MLAQIGRVSIARFRLFPVCIPVARVGQRGAVSLIGWEGRRSMHASVPIQELSDIEYHERSEKTMDTIVDNLERLGDETELPGYDVQYSSGVMSLNLGAHGSYVINKQPPNKQIWLSSPISGPKRFDFSDDERWICSKTGLTLQDIMNGEISTALGKPIKIV